MSVNPYGMCFAIWAAIFVVALLGFIHEGVDGKALDRRHTVVALLLALSWPITFVVALALAFMELAKKARE